MLWKSVIVLIAAANAAFGLWALAAPQRAAEAMGLGLRDAAATGEVRAVYGGLVVALGLVMILALRRPEGGHWLRALGACFLGLVGGRLGSLVLDGPTTWNAAALLLEGGTAALLFFAADRLTRSA